jgi:glucan phosphoethanolaminetransferase (alkaline phosphatase superfamily)
MVINSRQPIPRLALIEAALWFASVVLFLALYIGYPSVSTLAIVPHLIVMGAILVLLWLCRAFVAMSPTPARAIIKIISVLMHTLVIFWFFVYYQVVLEGLESWGQVVSWDLIASYVPQVGDLAAALGYSYPVVLFTSGIVFTLTFAVLWWYHGFAKWPEEYVARIGHRVFIRRALLLIVLISTIGIGTVVFPNPGYKEPLGLTFFKSQNSEPLGGDVTYGGYGTQQVQSEHDAARKAYASVDRAQKPNLVLIVVDALRPDHIQPYGYTRNTTLFLSELAQRKTTRVVDNVRAVCAETSCGIPSLASSRYLHDFSLKPFTIQEALSRNGYTTRFILGGDHINFYGLRQIYGDVDQYVDGSLIKGWYMNDDRWVLDSVWKLPDSDGRPTMFQILLMSAHPLGTKQVDVKPFQPSENYRALTFDRQKVQEAVNFYDNGVVFADYAIREILKSLTEKGYMKNTLVVITADHGEALGEHGQFSHAKGVYESVLRIPMIFTAFGYAPAPFREKTKAVSQIDIAPTILRELQIPIPASWHGVPLQDAKESDFSYFQQLDEIGLIDKRDPQRLWKYWIKISNASEYLFELKSDPNEEQNLIAEPNVVTKELVNEWRLKVRKIRPVGEGR